MKILKIRIKNLNSLKNKQKTIDFMDKAFINTGLFAITGETGAGKTTILDAVTVALFDRVPRGCDAKDLMTHYTSESSAEVEFSSNSKKYRAKWQISRAHKKLDGKIQPAKRELADISTNDEGIILATKKNEVNKLIEEITGLDYHRFLRSVMLAQGEFAAFLKAKKNERSALLERITGTDEYSKLSKKAYDITKEEHEKLEHLEIRKSGVEFLSKEQKIQYQNDLNTYFDKKDKLEKTQKSLQEKIEWCKKIEELKKQLENAIQSQDKINFEIQNFEPNRQKLECHQKAEPFVISYKNIQQNKEKLSLKIAENQKYDLRIKNLKQEFARQKTQTEIKFKNEEEAQLEQSNSVELINEVFVLDEKIKTTKKHLLSEKAKYRTRYQENQKNTKLKVQKDEKFQKQKSKFIKLEEWLLENKTDQVLEQKLPLANSILEQIQALETKLKGRQNSQKISKNKLKKLNLDKIKLQEKQLKSIQNFEILTQDIETQENTWEKIAQNQTLNQKRKFLEITKEKTEILGKLLQKRQEFEKKAKQVTQKNTQLQSSQNEKDKFDKELKINLEKLEIAQERLEDRQRIYDLNLQIKKYENDRLKLRKNEPCFLCGSTHHPFIEGYEDTFDKDKIALQNQKKTVKSFENQQNKIEKEIQKYTVKSDTLTQQIKEIHTEKAEIEQEFKKTLQNTNFEFQILEKDKIESACYQFQKSVKQENEVLLKLEKLEEKITTLKDEKNKKSEEKNQLKSSLEKLDLQIQNTENEIQNQAQEVQKNQFEITDNQEKIKIVLYDFLPQGEIKNWKKLIIELDGYSAQYQKYLSKKEPLKDEVNFLENEIQNLTKKIQEESNKLALWKAELVDENNRLVQFDATRKTKFGTKNPKEEQERLKKAVYRATQEREKAEQIAKKLETEIENLSVLTGRIKHEIEQLQDEISSSEDTLLQSIQKAGFVQFEDFKMAILSSSQFERLRTEQEKLNTELVKIQQSVRTINENLTKEKTQNLTTNTLENIDNELNNTKIEIEKAQQEIGKIKQILQSDTQKEARYAKIIAKIEIQEKKYQRWADLSDVIGSAKGDKFRVFAQGLTLSKLVHLANHHLRKLNPRYRIQRSQTEELELEILDTFQADNVRSMKTLSGGESFLVSLALALGLSDLAARKSQISSLFIDEGFGTLDSNTLEIAVATLETLQASGKMIGVISHVQALKERISTQIRVDRFAGGVSKIRILS